MWYERLFGDTARFAIKVALEEDRAPLAGMAPALRESWGRLEIHARGRCLTRQTSDAGASDAVAWYVLPLLEWLDRHAVSVLNEEPFVPVTTLDDIGDAIEWLDATLAGPPITTTRSEEDHWFDQRSRWWERHALRAALPGAAAPNVVLHRVGDDIEIAWNNEDHPPPRRDIRFVEPRGAVLVPGAEVGEVLRSLVREVSTALTGRGGSPTLAGALANGHGPGADAWKLLIYPSTRPLFDTPALASSRAELERAVPLRGAFVPHSLLTSLLRAVPATTAAQVETFASLKPFAAKLDPKLRSRTPSAAPPREPWRDGDEAALRFRADLGWDDETVRPMRPFLEGLGVHVEDRDLHQGISCAVAGFPDKASVVASSGPGMTEAMKLATSLGHLLLDIPVDRELGVASSPWGHWPTMARAKAFAAMLLMPEAALREMATEHGAVDTALVGKVMARFQTGLASTTWHLRNLRIVSEEERLTLVKKARDELVW